MREFKNEFLWSKSRDELFKECQRKYYYNHYAFWGGGDINSEPWTGKSKNMLEVYMRF